MLASARSRMVRERPLDDGGSSISSLVTSVGLSIGPSMLTFPPGHVHVTVHRSRQPASPFVLHSDHVVPFVESVTFSPKARASIGHSLACGRKLYDAAWPSPARWTHDSQLYFTAIQRGAHAPKGCSNGVVTSYARVELGCSGRCHQTGALSAVASWRFVLRADGRGGSLVANSGPMATRDYGVAMSTRIVPYETERMREVAIAAGHQRFSPPA